MHFEVGFLATPLFRKAGPSLFETCLARGGLGRGQSASASPAREEMDSRGRVDLRSKRLKREEVTKKLKRIPHDSIRILLLGENVLSYVPRDTGSLVNLTVLHLNRNQLTQLPDSMKVASPRPVLL